MSTVCFCHKMWDLWFRIYELFDQVLSIFQKYNWLWSFHWKSSRISSAKFSLVYLSILRFLRVYQYIAFLYAYCTGIPGRNTFYHPLVWEASHLRCSGTTTSGGERFRQSWPSDGKTLSLLFSPMTHTYISIWYWVR